VPAPFAVQARRDDAPLDNAAEYREESNPLREWLDAECATLERGASEAAAALRAAYEQWCRASGRQEGAGGREMGSRSYRARMRVA
jgi:phage/plasmid-associated DNA primase